MEINSNEVPIEKDDDLFDKLRENDSSIDDEVITPTLSTEVATTPTSLLPKKIPKKKAVRSQFPLKFKIVKVIFIYFCGNSKKFNL